MTEAPFSDVTLSVMAGRFRDGTADPVALVEQVLAAAEASQPTLNAFVTIDADGARRAAAAARDELAGGTDRGPLHGMPVAVKDIVDTAGLRTTMGARHFADHVPGHDAEVVLRLRDAGAVVIGKTTTHQYAFGPTGDRAANGPCANPHDPTRMAGGSSAGSAAAVGAGLVPLAVGTDTGGSVRIPAALCGVVGIRPSFGLVPTDGVFPLAWSLDTVGVLAGDVAAAVTGFRVLAGAAGGTGGAGGAGETRGAGGTGGPVRPLLAGLRIGLVREAWFERLDDTVRDRFEALVARLAAAESVLVATPCPDAERLRLDYATVQSAEAVAIHHERLVGAPELFDDEVLARLRVAAEVPAYEYVRAVRHLAEVRAAAATRLAGVDVLLVPTVPVVAPPLGVRDADIGGGWTSPRDALLAHCAPWSVLGLPSMSVPVAGAAGLPVGAQLIGAPGADLALLGIAAALEELQRS
jgi:aspartyl-tRNA(Asn)/glutamyl-tRNA(Gln) amidotransferase subunit A